MPVLVQVIVAALAAIVGVRMMVNAAPAPPLAVAPLVAVITPLVMLVSVETFLVGVKFATAGIPFVPPLQPAISPVSFTHTEMAALIDDNSATAAAARVREV